MASDGITDILWELREEAKRVGQTWENRQRLKQGASDLSRSTISVVSAPHTLTHSRGKSEKGRVHSPLMREHPFRLPQAQGPEYEKLVQRLEESVMKLEQSEERRLEMAREVQVLKAALVEYNRAKAVELATGVTSDEGATKQLALHQQVEDLRSLLHASRSEGAAREAELVVLRKTLVDVQEKVVQYESEREKVKVLVARSTEALKMKMKENVLLKLREKTKTRELLDSNRAMQVALRHTTDLRQEVAELQQRGKQGDKKPSGLAPLIRVDDVSSVEDSVGKIVAVTGAELLCGESTQQHNWRRLVNDKCSIAKAVFVGINYVGLGNPLLLIPNALNFPRITSPNVFGH
jgi:hypothetical protein